MPCPPPGDLPDPRIEPTSSVSPALADAFFTTESWRKPQNLIPFLPRGKIMAKEVRVSFYLVCKSRLLIGMNCGQGL